LRSHFDLIMAEPTPVNDFLASRPKVAPELRLDPFHLPPFNDLAVDQNFRAVFEKEAFGIVCQEGTGLPLSEPATQKTSKSRTKREWYKMVYIIQNWDRGADGLNVSQFHEKYYPLYKNWKNIYFVTTNPDGDPTLWNRDPKFKKFKERRVVHIEQVFDVISAYNKGSGHLAIDSTHNCIKDAISNVAHTLVKVYCGLCPVCRENQPRTKPFKGAVRPLETFRIRDRFQVSFPNPISA
jgi:hypothetical protein